MNKAVNPYLMPRGRSLLLHREIKAVPHPWNPDLEAYYPFRAENAVSEGILPGTYTRRSHKISYDGD